MRSGSNFKNMPAVLILYRVDASKFKVLTSSTYEYVSKANKSKETCIPVADPDLELRGGGGGGGAGLDLLALSAIFPSVISSFFTQNKGEARAPRAPPLDPPLYSDK